VPDMFDYSWFTGACCAGSMAVCCASVKSKLKSNSEPSRSNQTKGVKKLKRCWSSAM
jgi:hypothetical protein